MFAPGIENQFSGYDLRQNSSPAANRVVARTSRTSRTLSPGGGSNSNHLKQARQSLRHINVNKSYQGGRKRSAPTTTPAPAPAASSARSHEPTTRSQKKARALPVLPAPRVGGAATAATSTSASGAGFESPCSLLADFQYKKLVQTPASWLVSNVPIWSSQRPCCSQRVQEIVAQQRASNNLPFE